MMMNSCNEINPKTPKQWNSAVVRSLLNRFYDEKVGIVAGVVMGLKAMKTWADLSFISSAINKIQQAKSVGISDLRYLVTTDERLVIVRGFIQRDGNVLYESFASGSPVNCLFWKDIVYKSLDVIGLRWIPTREISLKAAPMAITSARNGYGSWVGIDLGDLTKLDVLNSLSRSLPLETVYKARFLDTVNPFFYGLKEEKILPVDKEVTVIGHVFRRDGTRIMPCDNMPFSLSDLTKDQILEQLVHKKVVLFYSGIALGSFSICVLAVTFWRYWRRWKLQQKKQQ